MFTTGMTSVTFRHLPVSAIARLAEQGGLQGIEWGGDVHLPPGDLEAARQARALTLDRGLRVLSYGSYYRLGEGGDFSAVLQTARTLGAPVIRIWAGNIGSDRATDGTYAAAAEETARVCRMAGEYGIQVAYEYHPGTLTDTADSALRLLRACGDCGIKTYWQPRMIPVEENLGELLRLDAYLLYVHVFHWTGTTGKAQRRLLEEGKAEWLLYLQAVRSVCPSAALLLEFTKDDQPENFIRDAAALRRFVLPAR